MDNHQIENALAINTGNMIASLNLQIAKLQVEHEKQQNTIKKLKDDNNELIKELQKIGKSDSSKK